MGVTIHYRIGVEKGDVKSVLDRAENVAKQMKEAAEKAAIPFEIRRPDEMTLLVDMGGCETLSFEFKTWGEWRQDNEKGWCYEFNTLPDAFSADALESNEKHLENWPEQRMYWCSAFCKTQFAQSIAEHRMVAELVRSVAAYSKYAEVSDEGDYYHTGKIEDAEHAISELGTMIDGLGGMFTAMGYEYQKGGDTKVKPRKKRV